MGFKITCPKEKSHQQFTVSAHVVEEWVVGPAGEFLRALDTTDVTHRPEADSYYQCYICGADAKVEKED